MRYFSIRVINGLLAISALAVFTHLLSPQAYGQYSLLVAAISFVSTIGYQWLAVSVGRFLPSHKDAAGSLLSAVSRLFWLTTGVHIAISFLVFFVWGPNVEHAVTIGWVLLGTIAIAAYNLCSQISNAMHRPIIYGAISFARTGMLIVLGSALIYFGASYLGVMAAFTVGAALAAILGAYLLNLRNLRSRGAIDSRRHLQLELFSYGLPLSMTYVAVAVIDLSDRFLINWFLGPAEVAGYAASYDFAQQAVGAVLNVVLLSSFPKIMAAASDNDRALLNIHLGTSGRLMFVLAGLLVAGLSGLAPDISAYLFGARNREIASLIIPIISLAIAVGCIKSYFLDVWFQIHKNTKSQFLIIVLMAILNVLANLILIPLCGVAGAALAALIAFSCGALVSWYIGWYGEGVPGLGLDVAKVVIAAVATYGVVKTSSQYQGLWALATKGILILPTYGALLYCVNFGNWRKGGTCNRILLVIRK